MRDDHPGPWLRRPAALCRSPAVLTVLVLAGAAWNPFGLVVARWLAEQVTWGVSGAVAFAAQSRAGLLGLLGAGVLWLSVTVRAVRADLAGPARAAVAVNSIVAVTVAWGLGTVTSGLFRTLEERAGSPVVSPDGRYEAVTVPWRGPGLLDPDRGHRVLLRTRRGWPARETTVLTLCVHRSAQRAPWSVRFAGPRTVEITEQVYGGGTQGWTTRVFRSSIGPGPLRVRPVHRICRRD